MFIVKDTMLSVPVISNEMSEGLKGQALPLIAGR
jgi:hypothetical protein